MKNYLKGKTINIRIFIPVMAIVIFQAILILCVFRVGVIESNLQHAEIDYYKNTVDTSKNYIETMMSNQWSNISTDIEKLEDEVRKYLGDKGITSTELLESQENSEEFLLREVELLPQIVSRNQVTNAFLVMNNSGQNEENKSSIFLETMNPEKARKDEIDIQFSSYSIVKYYYENGYGVGANAYDLSYKDIVDKTFFDSVRNCIAEGKEPQGFWSYGELVEGKSYMIYSEPILVDGSLFGVVGVALTPGYLENTLGILSKGSKNNIAVTVFRNDEEKLAFQKYTDMTLPDITRTNLKKVNTFEDIYSFKKNKVIEYAYRVRLNLDNTSDSEWYFYGISEKNTIFAPTRAASIQVVILYIVGLILTGIVLGVVLYFIAKPIKKASKAIESNEMTSLPKTNIAEVDILLDNLTKYFTEGMDLKASNMAAVKANEAKTSFLFNMSHDIRTPMNAIIGFTTLLEKNQDDPDKRKDYIQKIHSSSEVLLSIINNVLEMARIESGKIENAPERTSFKDVSDSIHTLFITMMEEKKITFTLKDYVIHNHIYVDEFKLREIYINLISNAYKYTGKNGSVSVMFEDMESQKPGYINIKAVITDTGIGMSEDFLPHLFDEFSRENNTTEAKIEGSGLGMSIVKKYVDIMGGTISVKSKQNEGTTFTVVIPCRVDTDKFVATEEIKTADISLEGKRILMAEDNDLNAEIAEEILTSFGMQVDRACDGKQCISMLQHMPNDQYHLILMDIQMPEMNGYEATMAIRRMIDPVKANIPILAMTANAFEEDKENARNAGMNGHIAKPIHVDALEESIKQALIDHKKATRKKR